MAEQKKVDYKKDFKELYLPKQTPALVAVPAMPFVALAGEGDPNGPGFAADVEALYAFSYAVKMSYKKEDVPVGYYPYVVFPLEGVWDLIDKSIPATVKSNLKYALMIRQPDFWDEDLFARFLAETKAKKNLPSLAKLTFETIEEGACCQLMHVGPYETEPESFRKMEAFCTENGYVRKAMAHREIYISDPRKTAPEKMKTVLRFTCEKIG
jgi:hypothetical protein